MAIPLKLSTASQIISLGPFVDEDDGKTAENGLTIANTDIKLHKAGGTSLTNKNSGGATSMTNNGMYYATLDATDTNTLGRLTISVHVSGALPFFGNYVVLPAKVYDSMVAGTDNLEVDTIQVGGTTQTARDLGASVLLSSGTGAGQISLASGTVTVGTNNDKTGYTASTVSDKTGYSLAADQSGVTVGTVSTLTGHTPQTGDSYARIGAAGAGLTALGDTRIGWLDAGISTRATPADVNAQVLDVLGTDTFGELSAAPAATSTLIDKIRWLFMLSKNKVLQTNATQTLRNDTDTGDVSTAAVSDDGSTFTRGEWTE